MSSRTLTSPPRGIDHLVIAGHDLSALAERYRGLGFQVGTRNVHPWGTENHIVQFPGCFLELIGIGNGALIPAHSPQRFSFGAFLRDYLAGGEGLAMLALESTNAVADANAFRLARIGDFEPFHFERQGVGPDGAPRKVSFSLAFAQSAHAPRAGFFTCQQHHPENFWNAERQQHVNGVTGIASVVLVADDPSDEHEFLDSFLNQRQMRATSYGIELDSGRGLVEVLSREAFRFRFGQLAPVLEGQGTQFAAVVFNAAEQGGAKVRSAAVQHNGMTVVPADKAGGVLLAFM